VPTKVQILLPAAFLNSLFVVGSMIHTNRLAGLIGRLSPSPETFQATTINDFLDSIGDVEPWSLWTKKGHPSLVYLKNVDVTIDWDSGYYAVSDMTGEFDALPDGSGSSHAFGVYTTVKQQPGRFHQVIIGHVVGEKPINFLYDVQKIGPSSPKNEPRRDVQGRLAIEGA